MYNINNNNNNHRKIKSKKRNMNLYRRLLSLPKNLVCCCCCCRCCFCRRCSFSIPPLSVSLPKKPKQYRMPKILMHNKFKRIDGISVSSAIDSHTRNEKNSCHEIKSKQKLYLAKWSYTRSLHHTANVLLLFFL